LNNLEAELTAAREELKETKKHLKDANRGAEINAHALRINADKLIAVTEQRDAASAEFYRYHGLWDRATKQLETVMYQRDRLAEALEHTMKHMRHSLNCPARISEGLHACNCQMEWAYDNATEALQSLTQPTEP